MGDAGGGSDASLSMPVGDALRMFPSSFIYFSSLFARVSAGAAIGRAAAIFLYFLSDFQGIPCWCAGIGCKGH